MNSILPLNSFMLKCISTCFLRETNGYVLVDIRRKVLRKVEPMVDNGEQQDLEILQLA
jgi:hypothetical protein